MRAPLAIPFVLICGLAAAVESAPRPTGAVEDVVVERRVVPVRLEAKGSRDTCPEVTASDFAVLEDGAPVAKVESLDRGRAPTVHAIVVDTSLSMAGPRLDQAKAAARSYVESLPADDEVLVASIDSRFVLRTGFTRDRRRLVEAIETLRASSITLLWDGIQAAAAELSHRPEWRRILIIVTDCEDMFDENLKWMAPGFVGTDDLSRQVAATDGLRVFPIWIEDREAKRRRRALRLEWRIEPALAELAERTGGELVAVGDPSELTGRFDAIRRQLAREVFLSYAPHPFGRCRGDAKGVRTVEVELHAAGCSATMPITRRAVAPPAALSSPGLGDGAPAVLDPPPAWRRAAASGLGEDPGCAGGGRVAVRADGLHGCVLDVLLGWDRGLSDPYERFPGRGAGGRPDRRPVFGWRPFEVRLPPPEDLPASLEEAVLHWLMSESRPPARSGAAPFARDPAIVDGRTWLWMRDALGAAIFDGVPSYRRWLIAQRRAGIPWRLEEEMRRLRESAPAITEAQIAQARARRQGELEAAADNPSEGEIRDSLAAWLGDVRAADVSRAIERWAANLLASGDPGAQALADRIAARWDDLRALLPLPTRTGILAVLFPVRDGDRIGFYRVVLPDDFSTAIWELGTERPGPNPPDDDAIPPRPLGLWLVRELLSDRIGAPLVLDAPRLVTGLTARRSDPALRDVFRVEVTLEPLAAGTDGEPGGVSVISDVHVSAGGDPHEVAPNEPTPWTAACFELPPPRRAEPFEAAPLTR